MTPEHDDLGGTDQVDVAAKKERAGSKALDRGNFCRSSMKPKIGIGRTNFQLGARSKAFSFVKALVSPTLRTFSCARKRGCFSLRAAVPDSEARETGHQQSLAAKELLHPLLNTSSGVSTHRIPDCRLTFNP